MSDQNDFIVGEIVSLKSGGPDMTISGINGSYVQCTYWNQETKKFEKISLDSRIIEKDEE